MDELKRRSFRVWDYSVSHSRLLIRSPKTNENVDIIFYDVNNIDIEVLLGEISLEVEPSVNKEGYKLIKIISKNRVNTVEAADYQITISRTQVTKSPLYHL